MASFFEEGIDSGEEGLDLIEVESPVVLLGGGAGERIGGAVEVADGDGAGAKDDVGSLVGNAASELEADEGIEDGLDGGAVGKA